MFAQRSARHTGIVSRDNNFISLSLSIVAALLTALGTASASAETGSSLSDAAARQVVDEHNRIRSEAGVVGGVSWDNSLASEAQTWADELARRNSYGWRSRTPYGENVASGDATFTAVGAIRTVWEPEKSKYHGEAITPYVILQAGRYTQMIWEPTTKIGCGRAVSALGRSYVVCFYSPRGNIVGERPVRTRLAPPVAAPRLDRLLLSTTIVNQTGQRMTFTISGGDLLGIFDLDNNGSRQVNLVNGEERYINGRPSSSSIHVQQQRLQPGKRHIARVTSAGAYRDAQGRTVSFSEVGWTVSN